MTDRPHTPVHGPQSADHLYLALAVVCAAAVHAGLLRTLNPYAMFLPMVILVARYGGIRFGLIVTLLCGALASLHWSTAGGALSVRAAIAPQALAVFLATGAIIAFISHLKHKSLARIRKAEQAAKDAQRMRIEEALRDKERYYQALVETTQTGYVVLDTTGRVLDANKEYVRLSGHAALEAVRGRSVVEWTAPYDRARNIAEVARCLQQGFVRNLEIDYLGGGKLVPVEIQATAVAGPDCVRIIALCRDITERRRAGQRVLEYQQQLQALTAELSVVEERERRKLAAILHDELAQYLALVLMKLKMLRNCLSSDPDKELLDISLTHTQQAIHKIRSLMHELSPPVLNELGLAAALEHLSEEVAAEHHLQCWFERDSGTDAGVSEDLRAFLYRAARELLINVVKHAEARRVTLRFTNEGRSVILCVEDDGKGFESGDIFAALPNKCFGLLALRERARTMGGRIEIDSAPGKGARVTLSAPL